MGSRRSLLIALSAIVALVLTTSLVALALLGPRPSLAAPSTGAARSITVIGMGELKAAPDIAIVHLGMHSEAETAQAALQDNNAKMQSLLEQLKALGIADRDIQTSGIHVYPHQGPQYGPMEPMHKEHGPSQQSSGYSVDNTVVVKLRQLDRAGEVLDKAVEAGANNMSGISFSIAEPAQLTLQAREQALADARARAEVLAKASGATLGQLLQISENIDTPYPGTYASAGYAGGMLAAAEAAAVLMQGGEQTVMASVQVTFELQ